MSCKFGRAGIAGIAGRGSAVRGMKETGPPPLRRGTGALLPRLQGLRAGLVGMRAAGRVGGRDAGGVGRSSCATSQYEKFQLEQIENGAVRPFAMAIRLTPELLSDLKRADAEGEACLMKFGFTATGHVLRIGDEEFKFNSAREDGSLCDIFEEHRSGEDGNGVLKEAGSVWRKLSVLRTLNASEKDRVKKRSVEAQQQQKSRKAIILDPTHSQNLTQSSSIAGDAIVGRRPLVKTKVLPPRKKCKPSNVVRTPVPAPESVPAQKPAVSTASAIASARAAFARESSVAFPERPPSGKVVSLASSLSNVAEEGAFLSMSFFQMDRTPSPTSTTPDVCPGKPVVVMRAAELRNCLISLLMENSKGMTLKAVEKSLGDSMPHVKLEKKTFENAIRSIASYHAPGKYILKEGVTFAKPSPNSGSSSPENAAADSPPIVDPPGLLDMTFHSTIHEEIRGGAHCHESGLLVDKFNTLKHSATGKASSLVQKTNENAVSRAIRKASESYQKSQFQAQPDHVRPNPDSCSEIVDGKVKKVGASVQTEIRSVGGDEIVEEFGDLPDMNGGPECGTTWAKSGSSESSSSSGSSDSDSESSDSGDSRSGTSDSGWSSSDSDDENMDEDVEIVSDGEDGDTPRQKPKANDKKKSSHQSKEAKRAKLKPPEKILTWETEDIDIGGDEEAVRPVADPEELSPRVVENLDTNDLEVDVVSVGGDGPPHNTHFGSRVVSGQQMEDRSREVAITRTAVQNNRELVRDSCARGYECTETFETGVQKGIAIRNRPELEILKPSTLKGRIHSVSDKGIISKTTSPKIRAKVSPFSETNNTPLSGDALAQSSSPSRAETVTQSLLDRMDISPQLEKEYCAKRGVISEVQRCISLETKSESEEFVEMLVESPIQLRYRPGFSGGETEAEVIPSSSRTLRDGPWRQKADGSTLLGMSGKFGRPHVRRAINEVDAAWRNESMNDPDSWGKPTRDLDGMKVECDSDVNFTRSTEDLTGSVGLRGSFLGSMCKEKEKKVIDCAGAELGDWRESNAGVELLDINRQSRSADTATDCRLVLDKSQSRELRKFSPGEAAGDFSNRHSPNRSVADFRISSLEVAGEPRKSSSESTVGDLRNSSPVQAFGDVRKPSPGTSKTQKLTQVPQKEPQRFDIVARDSYRAIPGPTKLSCSTQVVEKPEVGSSRYGRASNDTFDRQVESRGVKRQLDGGCERSRVYKKFTTTVHKFQKSEADKAGSLDLQTNSAGLKEKTSEGSGRKQRLLGKVLKSSAKEAIEPPRGLDWRVKASADLLGPVSEYKKDNRQSDPRLSNGKHLKCPSSPEEVSGKAYFAQYEKDAPDLRRPIRSPEEIPVYKEEYHIKYNVYARLYTDLDKFGGNFHSFKREMLQATGHPDELQQIITKVRREFHVIRKEFKRMQKTFDILHDELQTIKHHLRNFAGIM